jgi:hypothetical protein
VTWPAILAAVAASVLIVATGFLAGMAWQARRARAYGRAQVAFLRGGWRA